jgi:outer membrane receptor protein involved in Fe transport
MLEPAIRLVMLGFCLAAVFPAAASGQAFQARIIDKATGDPIPGAEIAILGHPGERFTDADGRIWWQPAPPTPFEVLVILPGGRFMKPVLVERLPETGALEVAVEALFAEVVTVTAGASPNIETTPASATTLVTAHEIATRAPASLAQALEHVAGVSMVSEGRAAVPAIRGLSGGRTLILLDGARVSTERRAGASATYLDPFSLESIEVARGPGSVAYGSDAFGGVIFARTRRVAPGSPLGFRFTGSAGAGVPEWRGGLEVSKGLAAGGVVLQAHARGSDDYRSPAGDVFNSGARDRGFLARIEHTLGPGNVSAGWQSDFGREVERPRNNSRSVRFYYPAEDSHRFTTAYELHRFHGFERVSVTGFLGSYAIVTDQDRVPTATAPRSIERADLAARDFQLRVLIERAAGSAHVEFGADINGRYGLHAVDEQVLYDAEGALQRTDSQVSVESARRVDNGFFASIQAPIVPRVLLAAGLRGDYVTTANRGGFFGDRSTSNGAASGYLSATLGSFRRFSFTGQVARGFRDPVLSDRYFRGPSGRGFITGNPDLEPETSIQVDSAVRYTAGRYRAAFFAYQYRIDDLIERYQTVTDFFFFRNRGRARLRGIEVELQAELGRGVTIEISAQRTGGRALDDEAPLDGVPPQSSSLQVRKQIGKRGFVQVRGSAYGRDEAAGPTERVTPGYFALDGSAGWTLARGVELRVLGRNLLDTEYLVSPDVRTVLAPGAAVLGTLLVSF